MLVGTDNSRRTLRRGALIALLAAALGWGGWWWMEKRAMDDLVSPGVSLINCTDDDVYTVVRNARFPKPEQGVSYDMGPRAGGGGVMCCVPIPTIWRPGITMIVRYRFGGWPKDKEETRIVELPEYPSGDASDLFLVFHSETEFELISSRYSPRHPRWPGRRVEPIMKGVE